MDLSKVFDCIPHDLVIAKLAPYGFDKNMICYIYSCLKIRSHCVSVNNINSTFEGIISGMPQGSIVGLILFNISFNNFFYYFILVASVYNFVDDNTILKKIENLISIQESESEIAINWFKNNHLIVNPGKLQAIIFYKQKGNHTNRIININQKEIKALTKVELLGIEIDDKVNFNYSINNICKSVSNHLNVLIKSKYLLGFKGKKVPVNTFAMSNFNYCSLV